MAVWQVVRHQVTLYGWVRDAVSGSGIAGASVAITAGPAAFMTWLGRRALQFSDWDKLSERPDRTKTRRDGRFHFIDLPDGQYSLAVSLPAAGSRYGTAQTAAAVERDNGRPKLSPLAIALPPTTIQGRLTRPDGSGIVLAQVRIKGSGERTFSNDQGNYVLSGVEAGKRTVVFSAQGFQPASQTLTLDHAGDAGALDLAMVPL